MKGEFIMKTNMINTNSVIKSICAVVMLLGMSVSVWGATTGTLNMNSSVSTGTTNNGVTFTWTSADIVVNSTNNGFKASSNMTITIPSGKMLKGISKVNGNTWGSGATISVYAGSDNTGTKLEDIVYGTDSYSISANNTGTTYYFINSTGKNAWINSLSITYANASACYVIYDPAGGTCATEDATEESAGAGVVLPEATPSPSMASMGWGFYGWAESAVSSPTTTAPTIVGKAGDRYYPDEDVILYAVYAKGEYTKITSTSDLNSTSKYIFAAVYDSKNYVMTSKYASQKLAAEQIDESSSGKYAAALIDASWCFTLEANSTYWHILDCNSANSNHYLDTYYTEWYGHTKDSGDPYSFTWSTNHWVIQNKYSSGNRYFGYSNSDKAFKTYLPEQELQIYKETKTPTYCSDPSTVNLVASPTAGGTVVFDSNSKAEMDFNTDDGLDDVGITATPNSGYEFVNWVSSNNTNASIDDDDDATTNVTAIGSATITANFYKMSSVTCSLTGLTRTSGPNGSNAITASVDAADIVWVFSVNDHYRTTPLTCSVTMGDSPLTSGTDYTWNESTKTLTIPAATDITGDLVITISAEHTEYTKYAFSCAELTLTPHLATPGTPIFITSTASKTVRSQDYIEITGNGLTPSTALTFPSLSSKFAIKNADGTAVTTDVNGVISTNAYIFYTPDAEDTEDGLNKLTGITVSVEGAKPKTVVLTQDIIGRHLPADFVIAVKHDDNQWYALPADMSGTGNPAPVAIRVDNTSSPTTAYCDNTNAYSLYASTLNNISVQLAMPNNPHMANAALWANNAVSSTNIGKKGDTNGSSTDLGGNYQWLFTQTATSVSGIGDVKYTMSNPNNAYPLKVRTNAGSTLWGLYSSGSAEIRLLSMEVVKPLSLKVMEWGTDAIVVSYPNGGSATSPQVRIDGGDAANVTLTSLGGDIYKIATISGLQSYPAKTLIFTATESSVAKQIALAIPLIVSDAKTEADLRGAVPGANATEKNKVAKLTDVIIRNGGRLTTGTASGNFNDVYIYPGGKAKITNNFAANNIYMRGGYSFLDEKESFRYPDLCVEGAVTIDLPAANKLYYDFYIDNRKYYMFSMPQDVTLVSVTDETGSEDFPVWVKHYDGNLRASGHGVSGWTWYGDEEGQGSFFAGIGYEITAKPKTSGRPIAIIRFPVITGDITTDAGNSPGVTVTYYGKSAYETGTQTANNVGWNFIGNPYLTEYKAVSDTSMIVKRDFEQHTEGGQWDGTYEWKETSARFITVPYDTYNDYHRELVKGYTIPAFSTFFFQFTDEAYGTFHMGGTRPQADLAPARFGATPKATPEISLDIMLSGTGEAEEGKAGLIIHESYDGGLKDFEDVEQWFVGNNIQKTYTFASGTALAYNLLNEEAINELIPMGYIATVGGEHVYALNEENDVSALEHLWLIDYSTGVTTDLLVRNYSFVTAAGRFDSRFAINAVLKQEEVPTDISNTPGGDWTTTIGVYSGENMLTLRGLPDNSAVYIYDMNGRLLQSSEKLSNIASFRIATQGVYNIRVIAEGKAITLRTVLR